MRLAINSPLLFYFRLIEEVIQQGIEREEVPKINIWVARNSRTLVSGVEPMLALFEGALQLRKKPEEIKRGALEQKREEDGNANS